MKNKKENYKKVNIIIVLSIIVILMLMSESFSTKNNIKNKENKKIVEKENDKKISGQKTGENVQKNNTEIIKVLISNTAYNSVFHDKIELTSDKEFYVISGKKKKIYKPGKIFKITKDTGEKKVVVVGKSKIKVLSVKRKSVNPQYRGEMIITKKDKKLLLCNKLDLEEYLYSVVASEISSECDMEALKAQAVCARSYAYNQKKGKRYKKYGADIDDSQKFQVYNNVSENERTMRAVKDTTGQVAKRDGKIIQTYYFATSWGYIASGKEVWNIDNEVSYLTGGWQIKENKHSLPDLSDDDEFLAFLNSSKYETYDSESDWYRWNITINRSALSNRIDDILRICYNQNPSLILTQTGDGNYIEKPVNSIGVVKRIREEKRDKSGLVTEIVIVGSKSVVKVITQSNIRKVLGSSADIIHYGNEKKTASMNMLPSAAICIGMREDSDGVKFIIAGGGFGHGTGMSQFGCKELAKEGKSYIDILKHYYNGIEIKKINE